MSNQVGVEKIEALVDALKVLAVAGKKVSADKKINLEDLPTVIALVPQLPKIIEAVTPWKEIIAEGKDIDVAEVVLLIQKVNEAVKEIEKA